MQGNFNIQMMIPITVQEVLAHYSNYPKHIFITCLPTTYTSSAQVTVLFDKCKGFNQYGFYRCRMKVPSQMAIFPEAKASSGLDYKLWMF